MKSKTKQPDPLAPARGPRFSVRFLIALLLMVVGIAWIAYYYTVVRVDPKGPKTKQAAIGLRAVGTPRPRRRERKDEAGAARKAPDRARGG